MRPLIVGAGAGFTVTVVVLKQPVTNVYDITDVPGATPVTEPNASTVATAGSELLQVPPGVASAKAVDKPSHTLIVPVITSGKGLTVTGFVTEQPFGN